MTEQIQPQEAAGATRDRILDAAEKLFADRGFSAASVRDITADAGANLAAVNYHFGGKEGLYRQMAMRLMGELRTQRLEAIRSAVAGPTPSLDGVLRAYARAFLNPLEDMTRARVIVRLIHREMKERVLPPDLCQATLLGPLETALGDAIRRFEPRLGEADLRFSINAFVAQLVHAIEMADWFGTLESQVVFGMPFDDLIERIIRFSAAGIRGLSGGSRR